MTVHTRAGSYDSTRCRSAPRAHSPQACSVPPRSSWNADQSEGAEPTTHVSHSLGRNPLGGGSILARPMVLRFRHASVAITPTLVSHNLRRAKNRTQKGGRSCEQWTWLPSLRSRELCAAGVAENLRARRSPDTQHQRAGTCTEPTVPQPMGKCARREVGWHTCLRVWALSAILQAAQHSSMSENGSFCSNKEGARTGSCQHAHSRGRSSFLCPAGMGPRLAAALTGAPPALAGAGARGRDPLWGRKRDKGLGVHLYRLLPGARRD